MATTRRRPLESPPFVTALAAAKEASLALVVDLRKWSASEQIGWPAEVTTRLTASESWPVLRDVPDALTLELHAGENTAAELSLVCGSIEAAAEVRTAINGVLARLKESVPDELRPSLDATQLDVEQNIVACRIALAGESRLLAAGVVSHWPKWAPPVQPIEQPSPAPPAPATVASEDASTQTPFERQVSRQFDERIPSISLRGMKLVDFSNFVSRLTGIVIALDEERLAAAGVSGQTTVDVQLTAATLSEVFTAALSGRELDFVADENRLLITTRSHAEAARQNRIPPQRVRPMQ